jgi:hypothetical protein
LPVATLEMVEQGVLAAALEMRETKELTRITPPPLAALVVVVAVAQGALLLAHSILLDPLMPHHKIMVVLAVLEVKAAVLEALLVLVMGMAHVELLLPTHVVVAVAVAAPAEDVLTLAALVVAVVVAAWVVMVEMLETPEVLEPLLRLTVKL